jgi:hypothetical protein
MSSFKILHKIKMKELERTYRTSRYTNFVGKQNKTDQMTILKLIQLAKDRIQLQIDIGSQSFTTDGGLITEMLAYQPLRKGNGNVGY